MPAAQTLVEAMRAKRVGVQERIAGRPRLRVLHAMSVDPLISSGKGTFVHDLIVLAGGENIAADAKGKHPLLSMEEVITRDPQVILLSSMLSNEPMTAQKQALARYREISAVRAGRILVIQADLILRPSPRIVDGLGEVARAIHPEAFKYRSRGAEGNGSSEKDRKKLFPFGRSGPLESLDPLWRLCLPGLLKDGFSGSFFWRRS